MSDTASVAFDRTLSERFWRFFFPSRWLEPPPEKIGFVPGSLRTEVFVGLDWKDRLRVLVSGKLIVDVRTQTSVFVDRAESVSLVYVLPPGSKPNCPISWRSDAARKEA